MSREVWRRLGLSGYFGLLLLNLVWHSLWFPSEYFPTALVLLVLVSPLMFPLWGLLHNKLYTYQWSGFISLFYLIHGLTEIVSAPEQRIPAGLEVVLSLMFFLGTAYYAKSFKPPKDKPET